MNTLQTSCDEGIFPAAIALLAIERRACLAVSCRDDLPLLRRIDALPAQTEAAGNYFN